VSTVTGKTTRGTTPPKGPILKETTPTGKVNRGNAPYDGSGLTGADRDAAVALTALFKSYGLESLAPKIIDFIKQGYSPDTIAIQLQNTDEYKKRFAANAARIKAGLPALSPAEYLSVESAYREVMKTAGVPRGFFDQPSDFEKWIGDDVSPTEIKQRVDAATDLVNRADPNTLAEFKKFYSTGDIIAYALDQSRAAPLVGKQFEAAKIAGAAANQGLSVDRALGESLANEGVTRDQAAQGFGFVKNEIGNANKLASISGTDGFSVADLANEVFLSDANIEDRRKRLASAERGRFGGSSALGSTSLSQGSGSL
jgi:hypothetical protein